MKAALFAIVWFLALSSQSQAGWYHVENFEGFVGENAVHFSIQTYDGFGSGITVEGSYFHDAKRIPIPLYGMVKGDSVRLCEIANDQEFQKVLIIGSKTPVDTTNCPFSLTINATGATGSHDDGNIIQAVKLKMVAGLDDTSAAAITGNVEIPFWAQTANHMFLGVYEKTASGICMTKLRVSDKTSGKVDQEILLGSDPCDAGMVLTPIYQNVENFAQDGTDWISISYRDGGMGYSQTYTFDPHAKVFKQAE